jgi:hypothetical protein
MVTTFLLSIGMLNMLIATMGSSYQKVSEVANASMLKERMLLIMENCFLVLSGCCFKLITYQINKLIKKHNFIPNKTFPSGSPC